MGNTRNMILLKIKQLHFILLCALSVYCIDGHAQYRKAQNLPFADQKLYHFGFNLGIHTQDMPIINSGIVQSDGEVWFAEIPSYSVGFSIGLIADRYLSQYFNLRTNPSVHFGEKKFVFIEQSTNLRHEKVLKGNYLSIPLHLKFNAPRSNNFRPYLLAGPYFAFDIGSSKNEELRFKSIDYGLEFGLGCNFYLPFFKISPEIKFSLGLAEVINKNRKDLSDPQLLKYSDAVSSGKNRMISLILNFE